MSEPPSSAEEAVELFLERRRRGEHIDCAEFAARYPKLGSELIEALDALDALHRVAHDEHAPATPGDRVGAFRIVREIGRGGMGVVLEAIEEPLGRRVALKVLPPEMLSSASAHARFRREAELAARLDHSGIATVYGAGFEDGRPWIAMRYVEGETLARAIARARADGASCMRIARVDVRGRDAALAVAACLAKVARALQTAHEQGVVHRDVKPSNVIVAPDGAPVLLDFGLAIHEDQHGATLTRTGETAGTPAYLAPESIAGEIARPDAQSDVYALGVSLYECLALRRPFDAPTTAALYNAIVAGVAPDLRTRNPSVPRDLAVVVATAMERERARRYRNAAALADDLEACVEGRPIAARPVPLYGRLLRWARREKRLAAATAAAIVIAIAGLAWVLVEKTHVEENARLARQRADDVFSLSALQDLEDLVARADALWPVNAASSAQYEEWMRDARALIEGRPADLARGTKARLGLAEHRQKLADLEARALPVSADELERQRATHPRAAELDVLRRKAEWTARMLGRAPWPEENVPDLALGDELPEAACRRLDEAAWSLVNPQARVHGSESKALRLAQRAVEIAPPEARVGAHDTLAWALLACGRFDEAVAEERAAHDGAASADRVLYDSVLHKIEAEVKNWKDPALRAEREVELAELSAEVARLDAETSRRREWTFASVDDRWWHVQLSKLVEELEAFADEKSGLISAHMTPAHGWGVAKRIEMARAVDTQSSKSDEAQRAWRETIDAAHTSKEYGGLVLEPRAGFLPIGRDPHSRLFEFAHLISGAPARRRADGTLEITGETGLVFVLIPAGTFFMGSQNADPNAPNFDPQSATLEGPVTRVTLDAFYLSKYEMTQGQWQRFTGHNPSQYASGAAFGDKTCTLACPVEQVDWNACALVLHRLGLEFPTEAQWEYAARAGTDTPWWTGADVASLAGAANLADRFYRDNGGPASWVYVDELDDGWSSHAPVGTYRANAFGLHDVIGNVWEWCIDGHESYEAPPRAGDGARPTQDPRIHSCRGGAFEFVPSDARSACRFHGTTDFSSFDIGVRPAVSLLDQGSSSSAITGK